jgi:hypothetical protein
MKLPLRDGTEFDLAPFIGGYRAKYPHIADLDAELAKMHLWLHRNPARHPVAPFRFVDNWLAKIKPKQVQLRSVGGGKLTESELLALGRRLGTEPRAGESWAQFSKRLSDMQHLQTG